MARAQRKTPHRPSRRSNSASRCCALVSCGTCDGRKYPSSRVSPPVPPNCPPTTEQRKKTVIGWTMSPLGYVCRYLVYTPQQRIHAHPQPRLLFCLPHRRLGGRLAQLDRSSREAPCSIVFAALQQDAVVGDRTSAGEVELNQGFPDLGSNPTDVVRHKDAPPGESDPARTRPTGPWRPPQPLSKIRRTPHGSSLRLRTVAWNRSTTSGRRTRQAHPQPSGALATTWQTRWHVRTV